MKEALVDNECPDAPRVIFVNSPTPSAASRQVVIRVIAASLNPKDYKHRGHGPWNQGDDIAGYVHEVGANVVEFKVGDRVAAFHEMGSPHGAFAEYAVAWSHTTFHIPDSLSFEEASTIPLAGMTAALGLYQNLQLPEPWTPPQGSLPLVVYGGASAVGAFVIKLAMLSNIHPIIAISGKSAAQVDTLIDRSKGDTIIDYRQGNEAVVRGIRAALGGQTLLHAFDAITEFNSYQNICEVICPTSGHITTVRRTPNLDDVPSTVRFTFTYVGDVHSPVLEEKANTLQIGRREFGGIFFRFFAQGLQDGFWSGHPYEIVENGLLGLQEALKNLKDWKASYSKYVMRIEDTPEIA